MLRLECKIIKTLNLRASSNRWKFFQLWSSAYLVESSVNRRLKFFSNRNFRLLSFPNQRHLNRCHSIEISRWNVLYTRALNRNFRWLPAWWKRSIQVQIWTVLTKLMIENEPVTRSDKKFECLKKLKLLENIPKGVCFFCWRKAFEIEFESFYNRNFRNRTKFKMLNFNKLPASLFANSLD